MKKLKNTDFLFAIFLSLGLLMHIFFLFLHPFFHDESYYATVPFRLVNGDSLIQHEWHLTQFASLFSYLPVYIWKAIKGSADSIFIFLRCIYLFLHTTLAVAIYRFFRKYEKWAILASMMFYTQIAYRIQAMSYQSMFVVSLLLLSLCLLSIYQKSSARTYVFAGVCFGCCCVCNPLFCLAFVLYLIGCALWTKRDVLISKVMEFKTLHKIEKGKKLTKKQKRKQKQQLIDAFPNLENYNCFFTKDAVLRFSCGILVIAVIAIVFFFSTGGTIDSIFENIENLLGSTEYDIASNSVFSKFWQTIEYFSIANLGMPWILPLLFTIILVDKKKKENAHRFAYLTISVLWSVVFMVILVLSAEFKMFAASLPFFVISTVCYMLTENKNKTLFNCMYIPCSIAAVFHYLAADTHLAAIGVVLAVSNVAGVFFAMDLWKEMHLVSQKDVETTTDKSHFALGRNMIIIGFCIQILFYSIFYMYGQLPGKGAMKATIGPYSGLYMTEEQYNNYNKSIVDLDYIKNLSDEDDPVLIASYNNWMYLYLDRPIATYTTWYRGSLNSSLLTKYYKENPEKIPKYVYLESADPKNASVKLASEMFEFTREDLSNGVLLTVKDYKF